MRMPTTNQRPRSKSAGVSARPSPAAQRRPVRMASLAAAFSLFALYLAWRAATDYSAPEELPVATARAQDASATQPTTHSGAVSRPDGAPAAASRAASQGGAASATNAVSSPGGSAALGRERTQPALDVHDAENASNVPAAAERAAPGGPEPLAQPRLAPATAQADGENADVIKQGAYLARAGDCVACHTADPARPFAGGLPIGTPFGTIYTPNITPDADTGIGRWTDAEFVRAMHEGVGKGGQHLYPAFPYTEYTRVTERDLLAIRAYLNTVAPIRYTPPPNELGFPFNQRWLLFFWKLFNFQEGRFVPDPKQSPQWNRGAYLVEGLTHCAECHTPRNFMQGLKSSDRLSGELLAGWRAYNITPDKAGGIGNWSEDDLARYLATGVAPGRANAAGPMAEVVENSTQFMTAEDLRAIGVYLRTLPPVSGGARHARDEWGKPADDVTSLRGVSLVGVNGAQLFVANCASCHDWTGKGIGGSESLAYPSLIHNTVVGATEAGNLAMVILHGVRRQTKGADVMMPGFASELNDEQVAAVADYVTQRFGNPQATLKAEDIAKLRKPQQ